ncbi:CLUMA_CG020405, isoform A [Clunio marinus]|uniref:CLUMA_CG020405, isoform A n=1 Tax=Clunio marinus TaxID=568069 RepID=A0A1J1J6M2_9DIPT|nr:CLUMA_CG020405, isoform A [Clunio marinus]
MKPHQLSAKSLLTIQEKIYLNVLTYRINKISPNFLMALTDNQLNNFIYRTFATLTSRSNMTKEYSKDSSIVDPGFETRQAQRNKPTDEMYPLVPHSSSPDLRFKSNS